MNHCFNTKPPAGLKNGLAAYLTSCDPVELYTPSLKRRTTNTRSLHLHTKAHSYAFTAWKPLLVTISRYNKPERVICISNTTESITVLRLLSLSHIRSYLSGLLEAGVDSDGRLRCYLAQNELGKMHYTKQNLYIYFFLSIYERSFVLWDWEGRGGGRIDFSLHPHSLLYRGWQTHTPSIIQYIWEKVMEAFQTL